MNLQGQRNDVFEGPWPGPSPSGPGPPPPSLSTLDISYGSSSMDKGNGGWDFNFVPSLDPKYECPICLMCLRDPWQTECGHRFCKACILRSLREAGPRCPVDNEPLSEQKMFPDGFAKREIMSLLAYCPFKHKGCSEKIELRLMPTHEENCQYGTKACPNLCGLEVRRRSFEEHVRKLCPKLPMVCDKCGKQIAKDMVERHRESCSKASIHCQQCGKAILREDEASHLDINCPKVVIPCRFRSFGCKTELLRERLDLHLTEYVHHHMTLLARGLESLSVNTMHRSAESEDHGEYSGTSIQAPCVDFGSYGASPFSYQPGKSKLDAHSLYQVVGKGPTSTSQFPAPPVLGHVPTKEGYNLQDIQHYLDQIAQWAQKLYDRDRKLLKKIQDLEQRLQCGEPSRRLEPHGAPINYMNRFCNGVFIWKLQNYTKMRDEAMTGATSVQHSEGFYTAMYGYNLCIRVNINATDSIRGAYISLFVHFMKGEYDNILEWPFKGSITLSILDQSEDCLKRKPLKETLVARSELLAFHRPTSYRNHKGFGYMEFAPLSVIENGSYIRNDSVYIKVEVKSDHPL